VRGVSWYLSSELDARNEASEAKFVFCWREHISKSNLSLADELLKQEKISFRQARVCRFALTGGYFETIGQYKANLKGEMIMICLYK
jgi:hypothetical protein